LVEKIPCPKCGKEVMVFNSFCNYCGAPIKTSPRGETFPTKSDASATSTTDQQTATRQFSPLTAEEVAAYEESRKRAEIESRNTIATILGSILLVIGAFGIILGVLAILQLDMATLSEILPEEEIELLNIYIFYATIMGILVYPALLLSVLGGGLIWYRPDNNAFKGFSKLARIVYLTISGILILGSTIVIIGWSFYYVSMQISGTIGFWLFIIIPIPVSTNLIVMWVVILLVFLICLGTLLLRTFYDYPTTIRTFFNKKIFAGKDKEEEPKSEIFSKRTIELAEIEKKRADMPELFHRLKNSPLTKTIELFGFSYLISFIIIFILAPIIPTTAPPITEDPPLISVLNVGLAAVLEEVSFRMILIGIPMIFVTGIKFYMQKKKAKEQKTNKLQEEDSTASFASRFLVLDEDYLAMDIPLAFLGKNKNIGIIEWILIGISGVIFGFAHWDQWTGSWAAWKIVQAGSMGLFLGYAFVKYGLASAIMIHFLNNVALGLANFAAQQGANWISMISAFMVMMLLSYGIMKAVSISVHYYHRSKLKNEQRSQK
jgi:hypothetical protein